MPQANPRVGILDPFAVPAIPMPVKKKQEVGYGIPVYWAGDHHHKEMVDGTEYFFEPKSAKVIYKTMKHQTDDRGRTLFDREMVTKLPAEDIVKNLMVKARHKGLTDRTGDSELDRKKEREAEAAWRKWWISECQNIVSAHEMACLSAKSRNILPPRPSAIWRTAKFDLDRLEAYTEERRRFVCTNDGMDFDIEEFAIEYVVKAYPGVEPKSIIRDLRPDEPKPVPAEIRLEEKAPPVQHEVVKNTVSADVAVTDIFMRAGVEGIVIPQDLREALKSNDPDILNLAIQEAKELLDGPFGGEAQEG